MNNGYIKSLDGLRAIAILLVMSYHFEINHFGWAGVQLFFVLSGFLISGILWKEKFNENTLAERFKKFWIRRSLRIFPLYFGFLIFLGITYLLFNFPSYYKPFIPYLSTYTFNYTRTFPEWHVNPLFTHLWSLSVEEQFYFIFPVIVFLCPPKVIKFIMITFIILSPVARYLLGEYYTSKGYTEYVVADAVYWNTLSHLDAFFIGGAIPIFALQQKVKKANLLFFTFLFIALAAGAWNYIARVSPYNFFTDWGYDHGVTKHYEHVWRYTILNLLVGSFILLLTQVSLNKLTTLFKKILESNILVRIGKVSYGMYVFHWAINIYFYDKFFHTDIIWKKIIFFIPYAIIVYIVAEISFRLYENKFIQLKDKYFAYRKPKEKSI